MRGASLRRRVASPTALVLLALLAPVPLVGQELATAVFQRLDSRVTGPLKVSVAYGAGRLRLQPLEGGGLYHARIQYDEGRVSPVHRFEGNRLRLGTEQVGGAGPTLRSLRRGPDGGGEMDLRLGRWTPIELELAFGAVRADLDLGGIPIQSLELATGASEARLGVSRRNPIRASKVEMAVGAASVAARDLGRLRAERFKVSVGVGEVRLGFEGLEEAETRLQIELGIGSVELRVPEGVGVRIARSSFLLTVDAPGMERRGDIWTSPDWDQAAIRLIVNAEGGFGKLSVRRIP